MRTTPPLALAALALAAACADAPTAAPDATTAAAGGRLLVPGAPAATAVVMSNLDAPRGLALGPDGALYVVESGDTTVRGACVTLPRGQNCYSGSGAVSRLRGGVQERVASGLPSVYNPAAAEVTGPHDIAFDSAGVAHLTVGWGAAPAARAALGAPGAALGTLGRLGGGQYVVESDVTAFEASNNPDGGPLDSNPYGLLVEPGGRYLTDAGGNALVDATSNGGLAALGVFPRTPAPPPFLQSEAVPTAVARGPDGALYVSTLTGVPFVAGAAAIYRVVPGAAPQLFVGGFKMVIDFAWGPDGALYVLQYASGPVFFTGPGSLVRLSPAGPGPVVLADNLSNPTSVLVTPEGAIYVSNRGNVAGQGEVLRVTP